MTSLKFQKKPWDLREAIPQQEVRFCTASDGVRIAYAMAGQGPPLVKAANWLNHLEYDWQSPILEQPSSRKLAGQHRLIRYDERGNGLSDRDVDDISFEAFVRDLESVVEAADLNRFALLGISQGLRGLDRLRHSSSRARQSSGFAWRICSRKSQARTQKASRRQLSLVRQGWGQ